MVFSKLLETTIPIVTLPARGRSVLIMMMMMMIKSKHFQATGRKGSRTGTRGRRARSPGFQRNNGHGLCSITVPKRSQ